VQITWLAYPGTTGLAAIDYLIADAQEVPEGAEPYYREKVLRLPDSYVCFDPPAIAPPVGPLRALQRGYVTFGNFSNPAKISPAVVAVWAEILRRVPGSRLRLKFLGFGDPVVQERYRRGFAAEGVDPGRLEMFGFGMHAEALAQYNEVDLALDTFPYGSGLTACESLWMGVPLVTFPGETFAGRHALSHLSAAGATESMGRGGVVLVRSGRRYGVDRARSSRLRRTRRGIGRRPAAIGRAPRGPAGQGGRLAAVRRPALRR
jgi:predicted O-linked N-acetylglucosamine transferase (SPINDLY family)